MRVHLRKRQQFEYVKVDWSEESNSRQSYAESSSAGEAKLQMILLLNLPRVTGGNP
jgi:hypothetical protein